MTEPIAPALTPEEWNAILSSPPLLNWTYTQDPIREALIDLLYAETSNRHGIFQGLDDPGRIMAAANAILADTDPRKITWAMVDGLREESADIGIPDPLSYGDGDEIFTRLSMDQREARLIAISNALASYLPPRL